MPMKIQNVLFAFCSISKQFSLGSFPIYLCLFIHYKNVRILLEHEFFSFNCICILLDISSLELKHQEMGRDL